MFYRFGHLNPNKGMKVGDKIKAGQQIGGNGTGNGQWFSHCHFDLVKQPLKAWTDYVIGLPKESVEALYADPRGLEKKVLPTYTHLGYGWLESAQYAGGHAWHSGLDLNGKGSGNDDFGEPIHCPVDGIVRYVNFTGANHGWGGLVVVEELKEEPMNKDFIKAIENLVGEDLGDNINEKEQKKVAEKIDKKRGLINDMTIENELQESKIKELEEQTVELRKLNDELVANKILMEDVISKHEENAQLRNETIETLKEEWDKALDAKQVTVEKIVYKGIEDMTPMELIKNGVKKWLGIK